jgi:hypothetical protein
VTVTTEAQAASMPRFPGRRTPTRVRPDYRCWPSNDRRTMKPLEPGYRAGGEPLIISSVAGSSDSQPRTKISRLCCLHFGGKISACCRVPRRTGASVRLAVSQAHKYRSRHGRIPVCVQPLNFTTPLWLGDLMRVPYGGATFGVELRKKWRHFGRGAKK